MGTEGWAAFNEVGSCERFFLLTADPQAASPIVGATTFAEAVRAHPPRFSSVQTSANDTAVILYTSGTTGRPKGAELSHGNILFNAFAVTRLFGEHPEGHDRILVVLPLFHTFGQTVQLVAGFLQSATLVLLPRFEAGAALAAMQAEAITCFAGVPTMYWPC